LLGLDDHPGELAGSGPVHAELARRLVREQTAAEWRYAITDDDGRLQDEGITRLRPDGYPPRAASPCRGGIVELHIKHTDLRQFAARPQGLSGWTKVIADLIRQTDPERRAERGDESRRDSTTSTDQPKQHPSGNDQRGPRTPGRPTRRRTEIRDRTCTHPRCRAPANGTDGDHTQDWAHGGATREGNIASACRHDHRLKHEGGWHVVQPEPGHLVWTSRLGIHYDVPPPLITQPLPDPAPREPMSSYQTDNRDDVFIWSIWREPVGPATEPGRSPPPDPDEPIPF
jgi:hypothetical protein